MFSWFSSKSRIPNLLEKEEGIKYPEKVAEKVTEKASENLTGKTAEHMEKLEIEKDWHSKTTIRHLVLSGGAAGGLYIYGALKTAHEKGLWKHENIKTIWGTSAGSMLTICLALKYEWSVLDDYLIKRPWSRVFKMDIMRLWNEKGIMGKEVVEDVMTPIFAGKGLNPNLTMEEFHLETGIEIHLFLTELDCLKSEFCSVDVSHKTHPTWRVMDAVYASCCIPFVFIPYEISEFTETIEKRRIFLDGGIVTSFPFSNCIESPEVDESEVLGFYLNKSKNTTEKELEEDKQSSNATNNLFVFLKHYGSAIINYTNKRDFPYSEKACLIQLKMNILDRIDMSVARSEEKRREYILNGMNMCLEYLKEKGILVPEPEPEPDENPEPEPIPESEPEEILEPKIEKEEGKKGEVEI